jgi:hypothetical protein
MKKAILYADVIRRLGLRNVAYVAWYRFSLRTGIRRRFFQQRGFEKKGIFFGLYKIGWIARMNGSEPCWQMPEKLSAGTHWTALKDFDADVGDIKNIWEASRFEWVLVLARAYAVSGELHYLQILNEWLQNWVDENPLNTGLNWKCGQEASMRVFNLALAALVLRQWRRPCPALVEFIFRHLERIHGNIGYAMAQDNNHGTSEAAALFVGGSWLARVSGDKAAARKSIFYARRGRKWLVLIPGRWRSQRRKSKAGHQGGHCQAQSKRAADCHDSQWLRPVAFSAGPARGSGSSGDRA